MPNPDERLSELVAAAVAGELTPAEQAELDEHRRADPSIDAEIESLRALMGRVERLSPTWDAPIADAALRERILAATTGTDAVAGPPPVDIATRRPRTRRRTRPRNWILPVTSAACLVVGLGIGLIAPPLLSAPPSGPPGTLGAVEHLDVREEITDATIDADVVAHTWGTEAVLDAAGLDVGATYSIVLVGTDGTEFSAGEMLGSAVEIHCRVNAAVLREDVARLEIRENGTQVVAAADLPQA